MTRSNRLFAGEILAPLKVDVHPDVGTMIDLGRAKKLARLSALCFDVKSRERRQAGGAGKPLATARAEMKSLAPPKTKKESLLLLSPSRVAPPLLAYICQDLDPICWRADQLPTITAGFQPGPASFPLHPGTLLLFFFFFCFFNLHTTPTPFPFRLCVSAPVSTIADNQEGQLCH